MGPTRAAAATLGAVLFLFFFACTEREPSESTYFDRSIAPVLTTGCVRTNTGAGCHVADEKGNALGNLDLSTFAGVDHRRDLLQDYGPYGQPTLLLKSIAPTQLRLQAYDGQSVTITTDIRHAGGSILDPAASGYMTLRRWIESGATVNNTGAPPAQHAAAPCVSDVPQAAGFDPTKDPAAPDFATFRDRANPVLHASCAAGNCHGAAGNDLFLTCGDTPEGVRWNYFAASDYLAAPPEQSELVRRPLAPAVGGSFHEGGVVFASPSDDGYRGLLAWSTEHGPSTANVGAGFQFFAHRVQPILAKKGCMLLHCHSATSFHDYRLRGGSGGAFSLSATRRNYALSIAMLSLDSDDVRASRLVRKNLYRPETHDGGIGVAHRGGPLLEDFGSQSPSPDVCDAAAYDYDAGDLDRIPAFCVIREWHARERAARKQLAPLSAIVYVKRPIPAGADRMQDFDVYAPGADLRVAAATMDASGAVQTSGDRSLTGGCGLDVTTADIRRPMVSWDAKHVAFAARSKDTEPLRIYEMNADGSSCAPVADAAAPVTTDNGLLVHDFDPAYSPPDASGVVRLVFASTRGNLDAAPYDYHGAQRTPADPTKANANLYVLEPDPASPSVRRVRQLTFLLDMERAPAFFKDGRVLFTVEKREPGFQQLALRRINIDGGDYHPVYGQRASIGWHEVTQGVQLSDGNFLGVFSDPGAAHHGGTLGVINRTLGIDFTSDDPKAYLIDSSVIDPNAPSSPEPSFFLHSLRLPDATASGKPHRPTSGVYSSPSQLPNDRILASWGAATDAATFDGDYDVYVVDPASGARTKVLGDPGVAEVEAVGVYVRAAPSDIFRSTAGQANAFGIADGESTADVTFHDARVILSLAFQNTPTGRPVENDLPSFDLYEELPPTLDVTSMAQGGGFVASDEFGQVYVRRRLLGTVPIASDGSARFRVTGGLPFVIHLPDTDASRADGRPRTQREEMMLTPGEHIHEAFPRAQFDGFCGQCHGAISGRPVDVAMRPDLLSGASDTVAHVAPPTIIDLPPGQRGTIEGPPER